MLLEDSTKSKANWKIERIIDQIVGKDGVTRGYRILAGNRCVVERPLPVSYTHLTLPTKLEV